MVFALHIEESGKISLWGYNIYKIRVVKNIKDAADFINVIVNNVDHLEDMREVEYTKLIKREEAIKTIQEDLKTIEGANLFKDFLKDSQSIEERTISISYKNFACCNKTYLNIFNRGYFFNECKYSNLDKIKNLHFSLEHSWEDLFEDSSFVQFLKGTRPYKIFYTGVKNKELLRKKELDFIDVFSSYFDNKILQSLSLTGEMEIVLNKGLVENIQTKEGKNYIFFLGLNKNNEKVFMLDIINDLENVEKTKEDLKNEVNNIIQEVGYASNK